MAFVFVRRNFFIPGTYQWVKPSTVPFSGPLGSTYLQSIVTCIGPGTGGAGGAVNQNQSGGTSGGNGGAAGGYAQATYLPAALLALETIVVAAGSLGGIGGTIVNASATFAAGTQSASASAKSSSFGAHITVNGAFGSSSSGGAVIGVVVGGSNVTNVVGGWGFAALAGVREQSTVGPGFTNGAPTWFPSGNVGGAAGGCASFIPAMGGKFGGNGGLVANPNGSYSSQTGGIGVISNTANRGITPGCGGGASGSVLSLGDQTGGRGADAIPNSGAGGGGGGAASCFSLVPVGVLLAGNGGRGSDGAVQIVDVYTLPPPPNVTYFNWDLVAWFHMLNQSRPISLTGRYKS